MLFFECCKMNCDLQPNKVRISLCFEINVPFSVRRSIRDTLFFAGLFRFDRKLIRNLENLIPVRVVDLPHQLFFALYSYYIRRGDLFRRLLR